MTSWAQKQKFTYVFIFCSSLFLIAFVPFLLFYHKPAACTDGKQNGEERGVDCGGGCPKLCASDTLSPLVLWQRAFKVTPGVYNAVAYIENPNASARADYAPYVFKFYDSNNVLVGEYPGTTFIPPKEKFAVFEAGIVFEGASPARTTFEFKEPLIWKSAGASTPSLQVKSSTLSRADSTPRVDATLSNTSLRALSNIEAVVVVSDGEGIAIGASRTFIDSLPSGESTSLTYTWPEPFEAGVGLCNSPVDALLIIDRSGSMDDDVLSPPEPLTSVKKAAQAFVERLEKTDRGGLVTFANNADTFPLTSAFDSVLKAVEAVSIKEGVVQNTNITEGLISAKNELLFSGRASASKIILLLTDGIATDPKKTGNENYPETSALAVGSEAKKEEISLFTIGLGDKVNQEFLRQLSSSPEYFYSAPSREDVDTIYKKIAVSLCRKGPAIIEIIPRVYPSSQ